jgi:hypothetical protein
LAPRWFSLEQTEGETTSSRVESPQWNAEAALAALDISLEHFELMDGNVQGYAVKRRIAVSRWPSIPTRPGFTRWRMWFLGTPKKAIAMTPRRSEKLQEVEAEGVAFLLCSILDLPGRDESRGYIQSWLDGDVAAGEVGAADLQRQPEDPRSRPTGPTASRNAVSLNSFNPAGRAIVPQGEGAVPLFYLEAPKMMNSTNRELLSILLGEDRGGHIVHASLAELFGLRTEFGRQQRWRWQRNSSPMPCPKADGRQGTASTCAGGNL